MWRRVVGAQGAVQLISAIAAMRSPEAISLGSGVAESIENILVIHDLSTTPEQANEFADCLKSLASLCESWTRIVYIDAESNATLQNHLKMGGWERAKESLRKLIGCSHCDELILGQNLLFLNSLLAQTFPEADKSCYGDGLAVNFTAEYYSPDHNPITAGMNSLSASKKSRKLKAWWDNVRSWFRGRRDGNSGQNTFYQITSLKKTAPSETSKKVTLKPLAKEKYRVAFDRKYLLFANMLDEVWPNFVQLPVESFINSFERIASNLHRFDHGTCHRLSEKVANVEQTIVLLSSNFSETKRMQLDGEVECYKKWIHGCRVSSDTLIVIKSHPRDSYQKIERIRTNLSDIGCQVEVLSDPWTFYVPFESIYLRYIRPYSSVKQRLDIICTSSSCLSLEYLFQQPCHLGFGTELVEKYFAPKWVPLRLLHEADLMRLTDFSRSRTASRKAAA
ncbi:MAG: hypothetical protein RLY14_2798 [Planctomycetota bacterium]|jgi:hypothetical protein